MDSPFHLAGRSVSSHLLVLKKEVMQGFHGFRRSPLGSLIPPLMGFGMGGGRKSRACHAASTTARRSFFSSRRRRMGSSLRWMPCVDVPHVRRGGPETGAQHALRRVRPVSPEVKDEVKEK